MPPLYDKPARLFAAAAKVEADPLTYENPTMVADAVRLLAAPEITPIFLAENRLDELATGSVGVAAPAAPKAAGYRVVLRLAPIGAGAAYAAAVLPESDPILRAIGLSRSVDTTNGAEKVTHACESDPGTTISLAVQRGGKEYQITGAVAESAQLTCSFGQFPVLAVTLVGVANGFSEQLLEPSSWDVVAKPVWAGASALAIGGASNLAPRTITVDFGLTTVPLGDANATDGHGGYKIVSRVPTIAVRARRGPLGDWNPYADMVARTQRTIDARFGADGAGGQYKRLKLDADAAYVVEATDPEDNSVVQQDATYLCAVPSGAGAELSLIWD